MAGPGGWNAHELGFSPDDTNLRVYHISGVNETPEFEEIPVSKFLSDPGGVSASSLLIVESKFEDDCIVAFGGTRDSIEKICVGWKISPTFLTKLSKPGSLSCFVHQISHSGSVGGHQVPSSIDIGFRWGIGHDHWVLVFGRYNLQKRSLRVLVSSRSILDKSKLDSYLKEACSSLEANPLEILSLLIELCGQFVDKKTQEFNLRMTAIADPLNVSDRDWALSWGIKFKGNGTDSAENISNLSTDIYQALDSTRWQHKASEQLADIGDRLSTIISTAISITGGVQREPLVSEEMADIIHRIRLNHHMLVYIERMLESQFQLHQNLLANQEAKATGTIAVAGQRDSLSMKTVSYLTMAFLPATFVSAVFSTSVFDFQNWNL